MPGPSFREHFPRLFDEVEIVDDFIHFVTADQFTTVATNSGTITVADGVGGEVAIAASDGTIADNDEAYLKSTTEVFKFLANKPIEFEAKIKGTATTAFSTVNLLVGLMDAVAADSLLDDGAGPKASYSGAVFCKVDGGTNWICESSVGTAQTTVTTDSDAPADDTYQILRIEVIPRSSTESEVHFWIDGTEVGLQSNGQPHTVTMTSTSEMALVLAAKAGAADDAAILTCDYIACRQLR